MPVTIENPKVLPIQPHERRILKTMFTDYERLVIHSNFTTGLSGSNVYLVQSIKKNSTDLPSVVKIDLYERIEKEWNAFTDFVRYKLSNIADIRGNPVYPNGIQHGGLWYPLAGSGIDDISSLSNFLADISPDNVGSFLEKNLFKYLSDWWTQTDNYFAFNFRTSYDDFLPLNLIIKCTDPKEPAKDLYPEAIHAHKWSIGDYIRVRDFKVEKLIRDEKALVLDAPQDHLAFRIMVSGIEDVTQYEIGEVIKQPFVGLITENRERQLFQQAQSTVGKELDLRPDSLPLSNGKTLPNPLANVSKILNRSMNVKKGPIHGDLNLENVLVDQDSKRIYLIDFVNARKDHSLRDLLHLEMTIVNKMLSETIAEGETAETTIHEFYQRLHCTIVQNKPVAPPTGQEKVFTILKTVREAARPLLYKPNDWREYYCGLFVYLLGSLRFGDLDKHPTAPLPKQLAFWGAATILDLMENTPDCIQYEAQKQTPVPKNTEQNNQLKAGQKAVSDWNIDQIVAEWQTDALKHRLSLFEILKSEFSMHELNKELAFSLGMDLDDLPSSGKNGKAQELIGYFERRGRIRELLEAVSKIRPNASWV